MDTTALISLVQESLFVIVVFAIFLAFAMIRGRQSIINVIMGLYLALLISVEFPYYDKLLSAGSAGNKSIVMIAIFTFITVAATILFNRLMPKEYDEGAFEGFGKKLLLALLASTLILTYSYHALPVTDLIDPGPIQKIFAPEANFFWWLLLPLIALFFIG